ncbi:MAG: hypothetical protein HC813_02750 [Planctomycetes bacterium]|nr:hypothetical protein [Planctomycetota bacterium]
MQQRAGIDLEALQRCGIGGLLALAGVMERLESVLDEIAGSDEDGVTVTPTGTTDQWDFTISLDLDFDQASETTISGRITFDQDPTSGVENGDTATIAFTQAPSPQAAALAGTFGLTFVDDGVSLVGMGEATLSGCTIAIDAPAADPLVLQFADLLEPMLQAGFANFLEVSGSVALVITGAAVLEVTLVFSTISDEVTFTNATLAGNPIPDATLPIVLDAIGFRALQICVTQHFFALLSAPGLVESALEDGWQASGSEGPLVYTTAAVPGASFLYDFTGTSTEVGLTATLTARVGFTGDPTAAPFSGTAEFFSFRLEVRTALIAGDPFIIEIGDFDATRAGTTRATYEDGDLFSLFGSATVVSLDGSCRGTAVIPATAPFTFEGGGEFHVDGTFAEGSFSLANRFQDAIDTFFSVEIVGIPVPANLVPNFFSIEGIEEEE